MNKQFLERNPYTQLIYRPFWITMGCLLIILIIALSVLINSSWRALHRTEPLKQHMSIIEDMQQYQFELNNLALELTQPLSIQSRQQAQRLYQAMMNMLNSSNLLNDDARNLLLQVAYTLKSIETEASYNLASAKEKLQSALRIEVNIQNNLLHLLESDNHIELKTTTFIAITFPLLGLVLLFFLRHRIFRPLDNLSLLISRVGRQTPPTVALEKIDPLLKPLFIDFNHLLARLAMLEKIQQKHQLELEDKVRHATQSLLEYQHTLAQSERLAAVGELSAALAHELRNPLAGVHLTLTNLRSESSDEDHIARLSLVLEELERITKLLNQTLDLARHTPEATSHFLLEEMLDSLIKIIRYQLPPTISIESFVSKDIQCNLPKGRLKQALLNLILNSAESIDNQQGTIQIHASTNNHTLTIEVCDNGQGFTQTLLEHGIQPFMSDKKQGTGLGLAMVKRFCYEQGGRVGLANAATGGACVVLTLPGALTNE